MARIIGIDYGTKRTGIATTDPLQIIVTALDTVHTSALLDYLKTYCAQEEVEAFVIGEPLHLDGTPTHIAHLVKGLMNSLEKLFPNKKVVLHDERFTSEDAKKIILASGVKKKKRRDKALVDKVSAVLILQDYLGHLED
ncbi:MAG: Holliday junction resolvase RuvX [Saprospiraceae bacterium]|nr:Holliday junction resolvase RuvX [Saprospiraceae bacterium]